MIRGRTNVSSSGWRHQTVTPAASVSGRGGALPGCRMTKKPSPIARNTSLPLCLRTADTPPSALVRSDPLFPRNQRRSMEFGIYVDACPRDTTRPHGDASVADAISLRSRSNPRLRDQRLCGSHMQSVSASNTEPGERVSIRERVAKKHRLLETGRFPEQESTAKGAQRKSSSRSRNSSDRHRNRSLRWPEFAPVPVTPLDPSIGYRSGTFQSPSHFRSDTHRRRRRRSRSMDMYGRDPALGGARPDPDTGLEGRSSVYSSIAPFYPALCFPGSSGVSPDCAYYMRTGTCSYGERCRYNHPRDRGALTGAGRTGVVEYPERVGQPVCEVFTLSIISGEKECGYYMKTGQCKFGSTCKFHHPQPGGASVPSASAPAFYPSVQHPSVPSSHQYPPYAGWQVARPSVMPGSYLQGSYAPMLLSHGVVPVQGWNPYPMSSFVALHTSQASVNPVMSPAGQQTIQAEAIYGLESQASSTNPALPVPQIPSLSPAGPSSTNQRGNIFPERPGQPECQFFMKTGDCKFGAKCKYHHPPGRRMPMTNVVLNALGLPLRPVHISIAYCSVS
ncbi:hypothetical protein B296_00036874 [Ensete ventricosum]|uniref:C3H1-type domain-containing protein n=1 Tax=Ensete ventricosum TaxID=4639 RepID=A0A426YLZ7_ENSVE|nr:hypothetical protein B296_00036874 [Ensete ventricosum]